jgi:predicted ATPase/DNA-binding SARP family transcriptional activator
MPNVRSDGIRVSYRQQYRRCGKPACQQCAEGGQGHGPYWYAYWREGGRTRTRYLGKQRPVDAAPETARPTTPAAPVLADQLGGSGLQVQMLGGFALWRYGTSLAVERWERQQGGALLKWLLGTPGYRLTRDEVVERFWPEGAPERGMANLRVLVHRLRRVLDRGPGEPSCLRYDGEVLALVPGGGAWLDAEAFASAARAALAGRDAGACRAALALYAGDYLPGDAYAEWALGRREDLRGQRLALLLHLAGLAAGSGGVEEAEDCLRTVLAIDRCHEPAGLALMRLCAAAGRPGQALRAYRRLAEAMREDLDLEPAGEIQALAHALAVQRAPAPVPQSPDAVPNNLPAPLTSFVGRRRELAELRLFLQPPPAAETRAGEDGPATPCRLLTLTGLGGSGKTRLALRLADDLLDEPGAYPDGVWLVELASLADSALVPKAVALALGVQEEVGCPLADTLMVQLKSKRLLLLLDNCEHLLDACAALAAALLSACPGLQVLATSRAALGVPGEQPWPVPTLTLPAADGAGSVGTLLEYEAVRLFLERARVQRPDLTITEANAAAVVRICRQLDGIPLALELAAARVSVLGLEQISERLGESVWLLTGGPRTAPRRQQTLRATLDWSAQLLTEPERALLLRLAVFVGGCTLEAVEAVCAGDGLAADEVLDLLGGLVHHSLVQVGDVAGQARYRLLETVRLYGLEQLAEAREADALQTRHLQYFLEFAQHAERFLRGPDQTAWLALLDREIDNLRAALARGVADAPEAGLRLASALGPFWRVRGYLSEGSRWLEALLQRASAAPHAVRAAALACAGSLASMQADYGRAQLLLQEGSALQRQLGDLANLANTLSGLAGVAWRLCDRTLAGTLYQESLDLQREVGNRHGMASALIGLGLVAKEYADYHTAEQRFLESLAIQREIGDKKGLVTTLINLGYTLCELGELERASAHLDECLVLCKELGDRYQVPVLYHCLGLVAQERGALERAGALYDEGLALAREVGNTPAEQWTLIQTGDLAYALGHHERAATILRAAIEGAHAVGDSWQVSFGLSCLSQVLCAEGQDEAAARMLGAGEALREATRMPLPPREREIGVRVTAAIGDRLGKAGLRNAWDAGRALTVEQAVGEALAFSRLPSGGGTPRSEVLPTQAPLMPPAGFRV